MHSWIKSLSCHALSSRWVCDWLSSSVYSPRKQRGNIDALLAAADQKLLGTAGPGDKFFWVCYGCPTCSTGVQIQGKAQDYKIVTIKHPGSFSFHRNVATLRRFFSSSDSSAAKHKKEMHGIILSLEHSHHLEFWNGTVEESLSKNVHIVNIVI